MPSRHGLIGPAIVVRANCRNRCGLSIKSRSDLTLARMGGPAVDINAARVAVMAPVVRSLSPRLYRRMMGAR